MNLNPAGAYMLKLLGKPAVKEEPDPEEFLLLPARSKEISGDEPLSRLRLAAARLGIDWVRP